MLKRRQAGSLCVLVGIVSAMMMGHFIATSVFVKDVEEKEVGDRIIVPDEALSQDNVPVSLDETGAMGDHKIGDAPMISEEDDATSDHKTEDAPMLSEENYATSDHKREGAPMLSDEDDATSDHKTEDAPMLSAEDDATSDHKTEDAPMLSEEDDATSDHKTEGAPIPSEENDATSDHKTEGAPIPSEENDSTRNHNTDTALTSFEDVDKPNRKHGIFSAFQSKPNNRRLERDMFIISSFSSLHLPGDPYAYGGTYQSDLDQEIQKLEKNDTLYITVATHYTREGFRLDASPFKYCNNLEYWMHCEYLPFSEETYNKSHAVIFRGFHVNKEDIIPRYKPPHQKWVFIESESPFRTWNPYRLSLDIWDKFNITLSYMEDSDITFSIFDFRCQPKVPAPDLSGVNYAMNKTGNASVLWMVSNCHTTTGRELYVDELQKYIDVDIYGHCSKHGNGPCGEYGKFHVDCMRNFMARYKFYLSFENSFCEEYVTEKSTKTLDVNVITVVMGQVDYRTRMTEGTYIDVRDFKSPKDLADHLRYVDGNDTAYNEYIRRKMSLQCTRTNPRNTYHCDLCHYLQHHRKQTQVAPDIKEYFSVERRCQSPKQFFTGVADEILPKIKNPS